MPKTITVPVRMPEPLAKKLDRLARKRTEGNRSMLLRQLIDDAYTFEVKRTRSVSV